MEKFRLQLITPEKVVFDDEVEEANIPTQSGEIGVLAHHVPLVSLIKPGEIRIKKGNEVIFLAAWGGCLEVYLKGVRILADAAERAEEIDEARAQAAKERAEKLMKEAADQVSFADAAAYLERSLVRLRVAQRKRRR